MTWRVVYSNLEITAGSLDVNSLHGQFQNGMYPGGNWTSYEGTVTVPDPTQVTTISLEATAQNISDRALGSGVVIQVNGAPLVRDLFVLDPATTGWAVADEIPTDHVIFDNQTLRVLVRLYQSIGALQDFPCEVRARLFDRTDDPLNWVVLPIDPTTAVISGDTIRLTIPNNTIRNLGLLPMNPANDGVMEFCSADKSASASSTAPSNRCDADRFDRMPKQSAGAWKTRGRARATGRLNAPQPEAPLSKQFLQAGGIRWLSVESGGTLARHSMIQDQADILYISANGSSATGSILDDSGAILNPVDDLANQQWTQDLDTIIIAGCAVLDIGNYNDRYATTVSPGLRWITTGPKLFIGYNWKANLDNTNGQKNWTSDIIKLFGLDLGTGTDETEAWRFANHMVPQLSTDPKSPLQRPYNACLIDLRPLNANQHTYWYFDQTQVKPFWTPKLRPVWPLP